MAYEDVELKVGIDVDFKETDKDIQEHIKLITDKFQDMQKSLADMDISDALVKAGDDTGKLTDETKKLFSAYRELRSNAKSYVDSLSNMQKAKVDLTSYTENLGNLDLEFRKVRSAAMDTGKAMAAQYAEENKEAIKAKKDAEEQAKNLRIQEEIARGKAELDAELAKDEQYWGSLRQQLHKDELQRRKEEYIEAQRKLGITKDVASAEFDAARQKQELETQAINQAVANAKVEEDAANKVIDEKIKGEEAVQQIKTRNIKKGTTQALVSFEKMRSVWMEGIRDFFNNVKKLTNMWLNLLGSGLRTISNGFKSLLSTMFSSTRSSLGGIINEFKGLIGIAGGLGLTKLGSEAISTANDFKNLGSTSQIVARQMSNAFYEAAGDSYNSLVSLSNGTNKVTSTLQKFINTWTGQVTLMKAQLTSIGANIGNLLIKVFYPLLQVLNKILAVVNLLVSKLASLFGFNTAKLGDILGNVGGQSATQNKGLESYSKATDKVAKSTKKLSDNTKKAKDNLQGYDKLNNNTTDDLDDLADKMDDLASDGLGDLGAGGIFDTDKLFNNMMDDLNLIPEWLQEWVDKLIELLKAGDWYGAGAHIGNLINKGLYSLEKFLSDESLRTKLHKFNEAFLDFANGLLDTVDWKKLGKDIALALNLIAYEINDLYESAVHKGTLLKIGVALKDSIIGFFENVEAKELGKAFTTKIRALIDIIHATLGHLTNEEVETITQGIADFVNGAFDRLLGKTEGEMKSGAEKIGYIIAKIINMGLDVFAKLVNVDSATKLANAIIEIINTAINTLDESKMQGALSGLLKFISTLLNKLATEIKVDDFIDKVTNTINNSIENGDVNEFVSSIITFLNKVFEAIKKLMKDIKWDELTRIVADNLGTEEGQKFMANVGEFILAPALAGAFLKGLGKLLGWSIIGKAMGLGEGGGFMAKLGAKMIQDMPAVFSNVGKAGGIFGVLFADYDIYKNGIDEVNASVGILSAALAGLSFKGIPGAIVAAFGEGLIELDAYGKQYPEKVEETGNKIGTVIGDFLGKSTLKFADWYQKRQEESEQHKQKVADTFETIGSKIGELLVKYAEASLKFGEWASGVVQTVSNLKTEIHNKFTQLGQDAKNAGKLIIDGLVNGIKSGLSSLWNTVTNICNNIKNKFKNAMQIHSPSRVMEDLGIFIPQGIALGIEDGEGYVNSAVDDIANSIKFSDFYKSAYDETDAFVDDVSARLQDINTPILDPLKYQANITSNPATTARTLAQSYSDSASQRNDGVLAGIYNRMISAGQASGKNVVVDVYLDKNNRLGQYIIDTMRGDVVMTGGV